MNTSCLIGKAADLESLGSFHFHALFSTDPVYLEEVFMMNSHITCVNFMGGTGGSVVTYPDRDQGRAELLSRSPSAAKSLLIASIQASTQPWLPDFREVCFKLIVAVSVAFLCALHLALPSPVPAPMLAS